MAHAPPPDVPRPRRVRACLETDLGPGDVIVVALAPAPSGRPREAILLREPAGEPRAYLNECKHLPVPLDGGSREFLDATGAALLCGTHGALYDLSTGYCYEGPCAGASLRALRVLADGAALYVEDDEAATSSAEGGP